MDVTLLTWVVTSLVILGLFVFDFFAHVRTPHEPTLRESGFWSAVYITIAVLFGFFVWWQWGSQYGGEYFAGYVTEKALSVDNLFVFVIILTKFQVPRIYQQKVLLFGILMALVLRAGFIAVGAAAISAYSWVFYLFGIFLLITAVKLLAESDDPAEHEREQQGRTEKLIKKLFRSTDRYDGDKLFTRVDGRAMLTPLMVVLIVIGFTDILFALDSIPAIYGLTQEAYLVFTANAFALMGLRQLYFLIGGLLDKLIYLSYGLSFILGFIGVKLVLHALEKNTLGFINGGEPVALPDYLHITTPISLSVIGGTLVLTTVASLIVSGRRAKAARAAKAEPAELDS